MSLSNLKKQRHIVGVEFKNHQELQGWCSSINSLRKTEENGKGSIFSVRGVMGFGFHLTGNYLYIVQSDEKPPPHKSPFFHFQQSCGKHLITSVAAVARVKLFYASMKFNETVLVREVEFRNPV